jgi:hypothetical protein
MAARLIRSEQPFALGDHGCSGLGKQVSVHWRSLLPEELKGKLVILTV